MKSMLLPACSDVCCLAWLALARVALLPRRIAPIATPALSAGARITPAQPSASSPKGGKSLICEVGVSDEEAGGNPGAIISLFCHEMSSTDVVYDPTRYRGGKRFYVGEAGAMVDAR